MEKLAAAAGKLVKKPNCFRYLHTENESNEDRTATDHEFTAKEWETPMLTNETLTQCLRELHQQQTSGEMQYKSLLFKLPPQVHVHMTFLESL